MVETKKELKEKIERLKNSLHEKQQKEYNNEKKTNIYYGIRFVQIICIGIFTFGLLWHGTEAINMTTPQFMMFYGGSGALISEVMARIFKKKILK